MILDLRASRDRWVREKQIYTDFCERVDQPPNYGALTVVEIVVTLRTLGHIRPQPDTPSLLS